MPASADMSPAASADMSPADLRAAVSRAVLRDSNDFPPSPRRLRGDRERLRGALKAVAQHAAVDGRRARVLRDGGANLAEALGSAARSREPGLLRLAALVFARLSAEADACRVLARAPFLAVIDGVLGFEGCARDDASLKEGRRLAARGVRNLAAFDERNAAALARESDAVRLLLRVLENGVRGAKNGGGEVVESAAAIANLVRYGGKFQSYVWRCGGVKVLVAGANCAADSAVVFHSVRALAEFSLEQRWQAQLVQEHVIQVALTLIARSIDAEIVSEATRCVGNVAASRTGREGVLQAGGVEIVARRVVMMSVAGGSGNDDPGGSDGFHGEELRLAADLLRAMANLCVGSREAAEQVVDEGGVMALIAACDQEVCEKEGAEKLEAVEGVKTEAFRGLLILAQAGTSFRATVLREIGLRTRNGVALGRCTAHLYDLARRIKVEASAELKDDVPQTIAGLGEASKSYLFSAGPLACDEMGHNRRKKHSSPNSMPGLASPTNRAFRQSGRVLSVQRPQHHRARLERERKERDQVEYGCEGCTCEDESTFATGGGVFGKGGYKEDGRMSSTFASSTAGTATSAASAPPRCEACRRHGDTGVRCSKARSSGGRGPPASPGNAPIPQCKVLQNKPGAAGHGEEDDEENSESSGVENNWAMQVWSFVTKPLARPARVKSKNVTQDLEEDVFEIGTPLGRGGFATVFLAKNLRTEELVAVKRFHPIASALPDAKKRAEMAARRALKEQRIWDGLRHRNIVEYKGCFFGEEGELNLVAEYIPGWSLADHLSQITKFPEHLVARITKQIVDGLDYLHREGVTHRDIKPANILVDPSGVIKLTDFGVSSSLDVPTMTGNTLVGTPHFIAPEMIEGRPYNKSVDIWSLGCTVLELATGRRPYHDLRAHEALFRIAQDRKPPPIPSSVSPLLRDFLKTCWVWDPEKRPLTAHLKRHPFLSKL